MGMFERTGVTQPEPNLAELEACANEFRQLKAALAEATSEVARGIQTVMSANDGPAADAFYEQVTGEGSIREYHRLLYEAAEGTERFYDDVKLATARVTMVMGIIAWYREALYRIAQSQGAEQHQLNLLVRRTRDELVHVEQRGVDAIDQTRSQLELPHVFQDPQHEIATHADPRIEEHWSSLTDEQKMQVMQRVADEYARRHGFPTMTLQIRPNDYGAVALYWPNEDLDAAELWITPEALDGPGVLGVVVHEMQHRAQWAGMEEREPWQDELHGMSREEAERWRQLKEDAIADSKGDHEEGGRQWVSADASPVEVDARNAQHRFLDNLSYSEYLDYVG